MAIGIKNSGKTLSKKDEKLKEPGDYAVVLLNDDYTTRDFVVDILELIFHKDPNEAKRIMLLVHRKGRGPAGIYTLDIAQTKVEQVHELARQNEFPLRCVVEEV